MILFECDYQEGAHPEILQKLTETNLVQTIGYGEDPYCAEARILIQQAIADTDSAVHFLVGGTQTNTTFIASVLRPHQGVLAAHTGHIATHETGAIEATGHKVITLHSPDGKIDAMQVAEACRNHWADSSHEHVVQPGMVYVSQPTESGTLYSKQELTELRNVCREYNLPFYIDGARLGYGLASPANDVTLTDLPQLCDAFYIGGTKQGALFGEALVINNPAFQKDFRYHIKQKGGLLAKGRLLGIQFACLFSNDLYLKMAQHAIDMAMKLKNAFDTLGIPMMCTSHTNQQFPILANDVIATLRKKYVFLDWDKTDNEHTAVRFCTSWATEEMHVIQLIKDIEELMAN